MTMTPRKVEKITEMFVRGFSLDLVSEEGVTEGWSREEAKQVVRDKGWALAWDGKLQERFKVMAFDAQLWNGPAEAIADADIERMITVGTDHELVTIRRLAVKAQRAVDDLRRALILQEAKDAEEVARRRRAREQQDAEQADPTRWAHGTWGAYILHKRHGVPVCEACDQAKDAYAEEASTSGRCVAYKEAEKVA